MDSTYIHIFRLYFKESIPKKYVQLTVSQNTYTSQQITNNKNVLFYCAKRKLEFCKRRSLMKINYRSYGSACKFEFDATTGKEQTLV